MTRLELKPRALDGTVSVLQLTDSHLFEHADTKFLGVNTHESLSAVIESIRNQDLIFDFMVMTGDISQDYSEASYRHFCDMVRPLNLPSCFVPGNHDDGPLMYRLLGSLGMNSCRELICGKWRLVMLNSEVYSVPHGWVKREELEFLSACVHADPSLYTIVCVHHLPQLTGSKWLDTQTMHNADEFNACVKSLPGIKAVLCGHVHQEVDTVKDGIRYLASPSTSIQFEPHSHNFALDARGPGWRTLSLLSDGRIFTQVYRLPAGRFIPDMGVGGY